MSKLKEACKLSLENWVAEIEAGMRAEGLDTPLTEEEKERNKIAALKIIDMVNKRELKERRNKKVIKIIIVSVAIMSLLAILISAASIRKFVRESFSEYSNFSLINSFSSSVKDSLRVDGIPDEYILASDENCEYMSIKTYQSENGWIKVQKASNKNSIRLNTEDSEFNTMIIDGTEYQTNTSSQLISSVLWSDGEYIFLVEGTENVDLLLSVAKTIK